MRNIFEITLLKSNIWFRPKPEKYIDYHLHYIFKGMPTLSRINILIGVIREILNRDETDEDKLVNEKKYLNFRSLDKDPHWSETHYRFFIFKNYIIRESFDSSYDVTFHSTLDVLNYLETFKYLHQKYFNLETLLHLIKEMSNFYKDYHGYAQCIKYFTEYEGDVFSISMIEPERLKDLDIRNFIENNLNQ